jgi:putative SOS response-associated peptidase YedK
MCGRYELHTHPAAIALAFGLQHPPDIHPRYNIAPMQDVPIVRLNAAGERELVQVRWGLVPRRARDPSIGSRMINARSETARVRSAFQNAFRRHRCLVPANGFYEWKPMPWGKQPLHVGLKNDAVLGFAGLYERWLSREGEVLDTCTILTTEANALLRDAHDRMPVIVPPDDYERWLDPADDQVDDLLKPYPGEAMVVYPVSTRVNAVRNDDATLIEYSEERKPQDAPAPEHTIEDEQEALPRQQRLL